MTLSSFSGSVDRQDVIEKIFIVSNIEIISKLGKALITSDGKR
jgi:hypothetical protein